MVSGTVKVIGIRKTQQQESEVCCALFCQRYWGSKAFQSPCHPQYLWSLCWILPKVESKKHKGIIFKQGHLVALKKVMDAGICLVSFPTSHTERMEPLEESSLLSPARLTHHIHDILREGKSREPQIHGFFLH